ncbi:MAG: hypothetical protein JXR49_03315 [Acidobacteria bacterium]|nr:hypothetical protein [Acidobacteriota bacterium]
MNCRTFQKNLEDYLENSLDFAGRFGMERHARQCARCGREMAEAQHLSRLVRGLDKVKAPPNFESTVLNEIGARKLHSRFPMFRSFLVFGFDMVSWRHYALAASIVLMLGLGFLYWQNLEERNPSQPSTWTKADSINRPDIDGIEEGRVSSMANTLMPGEDTMHGTDSIFDNVSEEGLNVDYRSSESDYREYRAIGPDDLPMIIPLPDRIHMRVTPPAEEYFIRNVSH